MFGCRAAGASRPRSRVHTQCDRTRSSRRRPSRNRATGGPSRRRTRRCSVKPPSRSPAQRMTRPRDSSLPRPTRAVRSAPEAIRVKTSSHFLTKRPPRELQPNEARAAARGGIGGRNANVAAQTSARMHHHSSRRRNKRSILADRTLEARGRAPADQKREATCSRRAALCSMAQLTPPVSDIAPIQGFPGSATRVPRVARQTGSNDRFRDSDGLSAETASGASSAAYNRLIETASGERGARAGDSHPEPIAAW